MEVTRYKNRFWAVYDETGTLVVVTVYKRGANEVKRRLLVAESGEVYSPRKGTENAALAAPFVNKPA